MEVTISIQDLTRYSAQTVLRRTSRISWAPSGWFIDYKVEAPATSFHVFTCPDDFYAARLGFANINPQPYVITKAVAAPATTLFDVANPTGKVSWVPFTFANGGADDDCLVTHEQAPTEIVVSGAASPAPYGKSIVPRWTWTDWVAIASKRRTDQPDTPRVMLVRVLIPGGVTVTQPNGGLGGYFGMPAVNYGFEYGAGWIPRDFVTSPETLVENPAQASFGVARATVACVQFATRNRGIVGMTAGDSHHQGTSTTTQFLNYHLRSTIALGSKHVGKIPFGYVSTAVGGATSEQFFSTLLSLLPAIRPGFVVLPGWTYNDRTTGQTDDRIADIFMARLIQVADTCIHHGIVPIFLTPFPRDAKSMTASQMGPWHKLRQTILDMELSGAVVLDATSVLGSRSASGAFDGRYLPGLSTDGVHPNDAGHAAVGNLLTPLLEQLAGIAH